MTLTELLKRYADPVLAGAGLRRIGRRYELVSASGDRSRLQIESRPSIAGETAFEVGVALLPASQLAWQAWCSGVAPADYRPGPADALWRLALRPPAAQARRPGGSWAYREGDAADCGDALADCLAEQAVPLLGLGQDRRLMLGALEQVLLQRGRLVGTVARTRALLLIDDGPSAELEAALAEAGRDHDDEFLRWTAERLAGRVR